MAVSFRFLHGQTGAGTILKLKEVQKFRLKTDNMSIDAKTRHGPLSTVRKDRNVQKM